MDGSLLIKNLLNVVISVQNTYKSVIVALAVFSVAAWFVSSNLSKPVQVKHKDLTHQETKISSVLQLPNGDGIVYVIESPANDFGFEVNACMLHVKSGSSTMACTPPKMKLPEIEQK
jgi:hypothetical protein